MTATAYPLTWPAAWPREEAATRRFGKFGTRSTAPGRSWASLNDITVAEATRRLFAELDRMRVNRETIILSTDLRLRIDGQPRSDQAAPRDPGAAVYWNDPETGAPRCIAIDIYSKVADNIAALAATIDAMRAIERHGGAVVLERAFTGFTALPGPIVAGMATPWWIVLELNTKTPTRDQIAAAYKRLASQHHPDKGGSTERMAEINKAREQALRDIR